MITAVSTLDYIIDLARHLFFAAAVVLLVVFSIDWLVRTRRINPFGAWPKLVRRASDPILRALERRVVRMGGNPQDASLWLIGIVVPATMM